MLTLTVSLLFGTAALLALGTIAAALRSALPQVAGLRAELADCTDHREVRFRLSEVVVQVDDGKVVTLPVRPRPLRLASQEPLRAAA